MQELHLLSTVAQGQPKEAEIYLRVDVLCYYNVNNSSETEMYLPKNPTLSFRYSDGRRKGGALKCFPLQITPPLLIPQGRKREGEEEEV